MAAERSRSPRVPHASDSTFHIDIRGADGQAEGAEDPVSVKLQRAGIDSLLWENGHGRETNRVDTKKKNYKTQQMSQELSGKQTPGYRNLEKQVRGSTYVDFENVANVTFWLSK